MHNTAAPKLCVAQMIMLKGQKGKKQYRYNVDIYYNNVMFMFINVSYGHLALFSLVILCQLEPHSAFTPALFSSVELNLSACPPVGAVCLCRCECSSCTQVHTRSGPNQRWLTKESEMSH